MCFASSTSELEGSGSETEHLLCNPSWPCCSSPSFSTPTEPARCKPKQFAPSGTPVTCGSCRGAWPLRAPCASWLEVAAAPDSSMDMDQEPCANSVCILQDIVQGSLSLHSSLSVSAAGQAGKWYGNESEFVHCIGSSSLMPCADNSSNCAQFIRHLPKRQPSNNNLQYSVTAIQASAWLPLGQEDIWRSSSSSLATASPPGAEASGVRMAQAWKAMPAASYFQAQSVESTSSKAVQGQLGNSNLQLQDWLEDMEADPDALQYGGNSCGDLPLAPHGSAATAACGAARAPPAVGLPAPAFVLMSLL